MLNDAAAVLEEAKAQLKELSALYEEDLHNQTVSPRLRAKIKNILENQRASLEYVAHAITDKYGKQANRSQYPMSPSADQFEKSIDKQMPGVRFARPDIAATIEKYQPYQRKYAWLSNLRDLTNENKHRRLTPQTRQIQKSTRVSNETGAVEWNQGVRFSGNISVMGARIDPVSQLPVPTEGVQVTLIAYVDWLFDTLGRSAFTVLREIQEGVTAAVTEICDVAGL